MIPSTAARAMFAAAFGCAALSLTPSILLAAGPNRAPGHVYVVDPAAGILFRFPLRNGIVASKPDSQLQVPVSSLSVAIGTDGYQYVGNSASQQISVYAPGARGKTPPIRQITLPYAPIDIAIDGNQYLYARITQTNGTSEVAVIAPDGNIAFEIPESAASMVGLDAQGNLYIGSDKWVHVYATPETAPTLVRSPCINPAANAIVSLAVTTTGHLFLARPTTVTRVEETTTACPLQEGRFEIRPYTSPTMFLPYIAASAPYLYLVDTYNKRVLELSSEKGGVQTPLAIVQYRGFKSPYGIALGP